MEVKEQASIGCTERWAESSYLQSTYVVCVRAVGIIKASIRTRWWKANKRKVQKN